MKRVSERRKLCRREAVLSLVEEVSIHPRGASGGGRVQGEANHDSTSRRLAASQLRSELAMGLDHGFELRSLCLKAMGRVRPGEGFL